MANLACLELHPHPVRAADLDHPDELRIDLDPVADVAWSQVREVANVVRIVLADHGLSGWPKTSGKRGLHVLVRIERRWTHDQVRRAALALAREVEQRVPKLATSKWWKEERHGVFIDYNQNAKDRTVAGAYSIRPTPDARVSAPLDWSEVDDVDPAAFTIVTMPKRFATLGDRHRDIDAIAYSLDSLLELSQRHERDGLGDAPWPPQYAKRPDEPLRVQPSRRAGVRASAASSRQALLTPQTPLRSSAGGLENLLQRVRRRDFELVVAARTRRLVGPPAQELRGMAKAVALQMVVLHFADALDAKRFPRQVLACGPPALTARHAAAGVRLFARPFAPRMIVEGVPAQRLERVRRGSSASPS